MIRLSLNPAGPSTIECDQAVEAIEILKLVLSFQEGATSLAVPVAPAVSAVPVAAPYDGPTKACRVSAAGRRARMLEFITLNQPIHRQDILLAFGKEKIAEGAVSYDLQILRTTGKILQRGSDGCYFVPAEPRLVERPELERTGT